MTKRVDEILDIFTDNAFDMILQGADRKHYYTQAKQSLLELVLWEIEKVKEGNYINSPDAQKALKEVQEKLKEALK